MHTSKPAYLYTALCTCNLSWMYNKIKLFPNFLSTSILAYLHICICEFSFKRAKILWFIKSKIFNWMRHNFSESGVIWWNCQSCYSVKMKYRGKKKIKIWDHIRGILGGKCRVICIKYDEVAATSAQKWFSWLMLTEQVICLVWKNELWFT